MQTWLVSKKTTVCFLKMQGVETNQTQFISLPSIILRTWAVASLHIDGQVLRPVSTEINECTC